MLRTNTALNRPAWVNQLCVAALLSLSVGSAPAFALTTPLAPPGVVVAALSMHDPSAWSSNSTSASSADDCAAAQGLHQAMCNMQVYRAAARQASSSKASLLVLPEGYGLTPSPAHNSSHFDLALPGQTPAGASPCNSPSAQRNSPLQAALSCMAATNQITISANVFVTLTNGTRRIRQVVFGADGSLVAYYDKHHLFPTEISTFKPGPFKPTVFPVANRTLFGIIICYEGAYPFLTGDFSQMDGLVAQNATAFAWSVGGHLPLKLPSNKFVGKYGVDVLASEDSTKAVADCPAAAPCTAQTEDLTGLAVLGYTAKAALLVSNLPA